MAIGLGNLLKIGKTLTSGALDSDAFAEMLAQLGKVLSITLTPQVSSKLAAPGGVYGVVARR